MTKSKSSIGSKSLTGEYKTRVLSEMEKFGQNLSKLSEVYGFEAMCLSAWKRMFLDTLWKLFSAMLPVKFGEKECLLNQSHVGLNEKRCSFLPVPDESSIPPASPIKVNTVSPLYRSPGIRSSPTSPLRMKQGKYGKYVPFLRLSGEWLLDYGFEIGKKYETYAKKNQLILKLGGCNGSRSRGGSRGRVGVGGGIRFENRNRIRRVPVGIVKDSSTT